MDLGVGGIIYCSGIVYDINQKNKIPLKDRLVKNFNNLRIGLIIGIMKIVLNKRKIQKIYHSG